MLAREQQQRESGEGGNVDDRQLVAMVLAERLKAHSVSR